MMRYNAKLGVSVSPAPAFSAVLDACCGSRMFWFDKKDDRALFVDKRRVTWPIDIGTPGTKGRSPIIVDQTRLQTSPPYHTRTVFLPALCLTLLTSSGRGLRGCSRRSTGT